MTHLPDADATRDWMRQLAHGSDAALSPLIREWRGPLHRFVYRYVQNEADARELVQETFVRVYQQRARFRLEASFASWAFTIAANLCRNHRRWRWRHTADALDVAPPDPASTFPASAPPCTRPGPAAHLESQETAATVRAAIAALPHDLRVTILLFEFDDLSYTDVAAIVGCSPRGVETRLARARVRLRQSLGPVWHEILHATPAR